MDEILEFDRKILLFLQENVVSPVLTPVMKVITTLGNAGILWIVLTAILLIPFTGMMLSPGMTSQGAFYEAGSVRKKLPKFSENRYMQAGAAGAIALILSLVVVNMILKNSVARIRPYDLWNDFNILIALPTDYSFPSGHTSSSFAAACAYFPFLPKKAGIPLIALASLIAFSRLYFAVHYPTDVLGGLVIGVTLGVAAGFIMKYILKRIRREAQ